ncbi:MAG TPA: glycosyltransferase [Herpetosiphonaceae bacterium]
MRCLIASDAPWSVSGYGRQIALLAPRLAALGHDVAILTTFGLHGGSIEWQGIKIYPGGADPFGNDVIPAAAADWRADIVITLKDAFVFRPETFRGLRWCPLVPVDHEPAPAAVIEAVRSCYRPIAYARNGERDLHDAGLDPLYAPHAYDPQLLNPQSKAEARQFLGIPDDLFLVGTVAVNRGGIPSRKAWPQNLEAFALFAQQHPDARYFVHTDVCTDGFEGGVNLHALCAQLGITDKVMFCDQARYRNGGFPDQYLHAYYNAIDVLNAVSLGEGFGVPTLESQACGTPVIVGDWAASAELCFGGWKVRREEALRFYSPQGSYQYIPQPAAIADRLEQAYVALQYERDEITAAAYEGAYDYQIDRVVATYWQPLLAELEQQIARERSRGVLRIVRPEEVLAV